MSLVPSLGLAGFIALAAALLLVARPQGPAKLLAALLFLRAGIMAVAALLATSTDAATASTLAHLNLAWSIPVPLLTLLVCDAQFPGRLLARRAILLAAGIATALLLVLLLAQPTLFVAAVSPGGEGGFAVTSGPLLYPFAALSVGADATLVVVAAAVARRGDDLQRRSAAIFGLAFSLFALYAGSFFLARALVAPAELRAPLFAIRAVATVAAGIVVATRLPPLARALRGSAAILAGGLALCALGAFDGVLSTHPLLLAYVPGYEGSTLALRALSAGALFVVAARYGLADAGTRARAALTRGTRAALAIVAGSLGGIIALVVLGPNAVGAGAALLTGIGISALTWKPLAAPAHALAQRLLLRAEDPRASAERARAYAAALDAALGPDASLSAEGERLLAELRADLLISLSEHMLLLASAQGRRAQPGAPVLGRFRATRRLGAGASSVVDLAQDDATGEIAVVKRVRAGRATEAVLREARAMASVRHPRVLRLRGIERQGDEIALLMDFAAGGNARALAPLDPARAVSLALDWVDGLEALHAAGLAHGDVKLENLLIDAAGRGVVGDMGSAHATDADATVTGASSEATLGTVAPEILSGHASSPAADTYALAASLYRLLTSEHYVGLEGASAFAAMEAIRASPPRLPHPRIPVAVAALLGDALAKDPHARPSLALVRARLAAVTLAARDGIVPA